MADSNIGALPQAAQLDDDSLLVAEQQGQAVKVTGAQFKEFGRQAVVGQVQGYVDAAEKAAGEAVEAVSAVTGMTVEAQASQTASVSKSTRDGKVHLVFGLPRGEQGVAGPEGPAGPRGARGETGKGLDILGYYPDQEALERAVTAPEPGDAYGVGTEAPYDIYVFDSVTQAWKNNGPLSGGGGVVSEDVVTCEGGAALEIPGVFGDAPHVISFDEEEEAPLSAEDIAYGEESVKEALDGLFTCVSDGKARIASAVTDKGVPTGPDASFAEMAEHIGQISGGGDTSDATAAPGDILAGRTAYTASGKVEGIIPTLPARTYTPGTQPQTIANGQYLGGTQTIQGDPNLTSGNIKKGVSIFGVEGVVEQSFLATLTVTADVGAVVTATHTSGTEVEALSVTGTVTLELPLEGQWTVTARRGVAQYNSVVVTVSSQYSAALTAEVHIEYYTQGSSLSASRSGLAAVAVGDYALFGGGHEKYVSGSPVTGKIVDAYNKSLVHSTPAQLNNGRLYLSAAANENYALFAGGFGPVDNVESYNKSLTRGTAASLSEGRYNIGAAVIGDYVVFGGGDTSEKYTYSTAVDVYDGSLVHSMATPFVQAPDSFTAAANENYILFAAGSSIYAYDKNLTRSIPTALSEARYKLTGARAGNYAVFAGGNQPSAIVDVYDLFLTRTTAEPLQRARSYMGATTVGNYAVFGGGYTKSGNITSSVTYADVSNLVDVYDPYLTHTTPDALKTGADTPAGVTNGNYALFGGSTTKFYSDSVNIYRYV